MSQATTTRISEIGTVGIPVADQERALTFYRDTLGFEVRMDASYGPDRWIELAPRGGATSIALVQARGDLAAGVDTGHPVDDRRRRRGSRGAARRGDLDR